MKVAVEASSVLSTAGPPNTLCYCERMSSMALVQAELLLVEPVSASVQATGAFLRIGIIGVKIVGLLPRQW